MGGYYTSHIGLLQYQTRRPHTLKAGLIITNIAAYPANKDDSDHQGNSADLRHTVFSSLFPLCEAAPHKRILFSAPMFASFFIPSTFVIFLQRCVPPVPPSHSIRPVTLGSSVHLRQSRAGCAPAPRQRFPGHTYTVCTVRAHALVLIC